MSVSTQANVAPGYAVVEVGIDAAGDTMVEETGRALTYLPQTLDEYLALPEHESATCPRDAWAGVIMHRDICRCAKCGYRWRWPFSVGLD